MEKAVLFKKLFDFVKNGCNLLMSAYDMRKSDDISLCKVVFQ